MERNETTPWRRVANVTLLILAWLTVSPLMIPVNRKGSYLSKKALVWLILLSPFVWCVLSVLFLVVGVPVISSISPSFGQTLTSFPEFTGALDGSGDFWQLALIIYFLPLYSFCVLVLFIAMAFTGWSYITASVYICEYFQPWFCIGVACLIIWRIARSWRGMTAQGRWLTVLPIFGEMALAVFSFLVFRNRIVTYENMSHSQIFSTAVDMLLTLGETTHTNYITANIIVYILPLVLILLTGYLGWLIYTVNRKGRG